MNTYPDIDITVSTLTYGGEGLGRLEDGRAVFVPYVLPGEEVRIRLAEEKRRFARAKLVEVLKPSAIRIEPRCPHFTTCGGCHYQHMSHSDQLEVKAGILTDQLERIGGINNAPIRPTIPAPFPWNYRNHVQFHLTKDGYLGYMEAKSDEVFGIKECHLPELPINSIWPQLKFEPIQDLEGVGLRVGIEDDIQLILESNELNAPDLSVENLALSVVHLSPAGTLVLAGSDYVLVELRERLFRVSAGSFFQVNTPMAAVMVEHILSNLQLKPSSTILDVYCGVGLFSAFLAQAGVRVVGIESNSYACDDFVINLDAFDNIELYEAKVEAVLHNLKFNAAVILVDPPRSGLSRRAMQGILAQEAHSLVYISCDPATLARDARKLSDRGYQLTQITPFDLFPQTYHIECISFWERVK